MRVKAIVCDDFVNYRKPSMFISTCFCDWKCCVDGGFDSSICQNNPMKDYPIQDFSNEELYSFYEKSMFSESIVFGGLEPIKQFDEIISFVEYFRTKSLDDIVIYTGYNEREVQKEILSLKKYKNIIIKFGRFVPNQQKHFDCVLGVSLVSDNQYGKVIS